MNKEILNYTYYERIVNDYSKDKIFNQSLLHVSVFNKINLSFFKIATKKNVAFNVIIKIPKIYEELLFELYSNIYLLAANQQFYESYANPEYKLGAILMEKGKQGKRKVRVVALKDGLFTLEEIKKERVGNFSGPAIYLDRSYNYLLKNFVHIKRGIQKRSLENYLELFCQLNNLSQKEDVIPTEFNSVSVFIGSRMLWDSFRSVELLKSNLWNSIPCQYINREGKKSETIGISPLIYFVPNYKSANEFIISKGIRVYNIILFDEINQVIQDQNQYDFTIFGVSTRSIENRLEHIKYWEWHKEEIDLINTL